MPLRYERARARERVVQELLRMHNLDIHQVNEHELVQLIREAKPPEFMRERDQNTLISASLPDICARILHYLKIKAKQQSTSLTNKAQIITYIEDTEVLIEEAKKRLEHLKNLLL